jgi:hypothetical protein
MTGFGEFGVAADTTGGNNPLPVTIINFSGMADARNAYLNWTTANEVNNKGFDVERSVDGKNFIKVGFVKGAGNSNQVQKYAMMDANAFENAKSNILYYRLKQFDFNGKYTYTEMVTVNTNKMGADAITVSPNPFNAEFSLSVVASKEGVAEIVIMDLQGRTVATATMNCTTGANKQSISELANANSGVYFVRCTLNGETSVTRLVKMN